MKNILLSAPLLAYVRSAGDTTTIYDKNGLADGVEGAYTTVFKYVNTVN
jgi:hypothetical protein